MAKSDKNAEHYGKIECAIPALTGMVLGLANMCRIVTGSPLDAVSAALSGSLLGSAICLSAFAVATVSAAVVARIWIVALIAFGFISFGNEIVLALISWDFLRNEIVAAAADAVIWIVSGLIASELIFGHLRNREFELCCVLGLLQIAAAVSLRIQYGVAISFGSCPEIWRVLIVFVGFFAATLTATHLGFSPLRWLARISHASHVQRGSA